VVWLSSIPGIGAVKSGKLLEHFGDIHNVWSATAAELAVLPFLNRKDILNLTNVKFKQDVERHLENIHKNDIKVIHWKMNCILRTLKTYMILLGSLYEGNHSRGGKISGCGWFKKSDVLWTGYGEENIPRAC